MRLPNIRAVALVAGLVLAALNLRPALTSLSPLIGELRRDLSLSASAASLLTTLPVLCFGLVAGFAPPIARRIGPERALVGCLFVIGSGTVLRGVPYAAPLFVGMALAGAGIALGNVLVPTIIKRGFPNRVGPLTGVSTMSMSIGGSLAAATTVPIQRAFGHGWAPALAIWAAPALLAAVAWLPYAVGRTPGPADGSRTGFGHLLRSGLAWKVTAFMGLQSLNFYVLISWLPSAYVAHGLTKAEAGVLLSIMQIAGIPASLTVPMLAARRRSQRPYAAAAVGLAAVGMIGILVRPLVVPMLWPAILGVGVGGLFGLAFTFMVLRAPDSLAASQLSAMAQSVGYVLAALGPLVIGALHDLTGGWHLPLTILATMYVPLLLAGLGAAAPRQVKVALDRDRTARSAPDTAP